MAEVPYNPLDKLHLAESVANALLREPLTRLPPPKPFEGAGIYVLYYLGGFEPYAPIAAERIPIYVGKAVPKGARRGGYGLGAAPGKVLYKRLREHAQSLDGLSNLELADFRCRFLVVDDIWIPLGESLLIAKFQPVWNTIVHGFGIHVPGKGRELQKKSIWDTLHPGRGLAKKLPSHTKATEEILRELKEHLAKRTK